MPSHQLPNYIRTDYWQTRSYLKSFSVLVFLYSLYGCASNPYEVTFGNIVLFTPKPTAITEYVQDPGLETCIRLLMTSSGVNKPEEIKLLTCPAQGVNNLVGLKKFLALEQLELSNNSLQEIGEIGELRNLRMLSLRNNNIRALDELFELD